ncbi:endonuclease NucS domain-containing protein [Desulfurivibrio dismutans]|uniref:endonuclease NucS domain-containing protein n=1 Tax=Desulfurivibrio dismutans TaxID=1398908 RepID=UPI0023DCCCDC|nr:endonuclease NucS domain-containing protein [Desulfurivibrio alkaliphilus]MDF1615788.1 endonuclease NucS [Desulfurivibrio alkaliphilus]
MFHVDIEGKQLRRLIPKGFSELGLRERFDIQEWIERTPEILGEELLIIGKEVILASGKRLDLLAIDKRAALVIIELKRDDSGEAVEWQAIKYASYCGNFLSEEIYNQVALYLGISEVEAQKAIEEFIDADIEELNAIQRIILAARQFNSEVISAVIWLREFGVDIQCTRLAPFLDAQGSLFINPETIIPLPEAKDYIEKKEKKQRAGAQDHREWTGYWFVNVGEGPTRNWQDNVKFGYIGAGQGVRYSSALKRLSVGDKIYAYMKGIGYVGFGEVISPAVMVRDFIVEESGIPLLEAGLTAPEADANRDDEELAEWAVGIRWIKAFTKNEAKTFSGVFANQNVVCKLRNQQTLLFVKEAFGE